MIFNYYIYIPIGTLLVLKENIITIYNISKIIHKQIILNTSYYFQISSYKNIKK